MNIMWSDIVELFFLGQSTSIFTIWTEEWISVEQEGVIYQILFCVYKWCNDTAVINKQKF